MQYNNTEEKLLQLYPSYQGMSSSSSSSAPPSSAVPSSSPIYNPHDQAAPDRFLVNDVGCCGLICPSLLTCCLSSLGCFMCTCPLQIDVRNEAVLLSFGRYMGSLREPGLYCVNYCGTTVKRVSTSINAVDIPNLKVIDKRGNPLNVSGVVNYEVENSRKALLDVSNYSLFLRSQAEVVLKQICSLHPYESKEGSGEECLKRESGKIRYDIIELLQAKVARAGIRILQYEFNEISYAPEIASQMLVRQQAEAMVDARKVMVEGAVLIANDAVAALRSKGITMESNEAARLAANLVITICSETRVTPTLSLSDKPQPARMG